MFGEMVGGAGCVGGQEKEWTACFLDYLRAFGINADQWTTAAQDEGEWRAERQNKGRNISWQNGSLQKNTRLDYGMHTVVCPNVTGRTKERIAQSKRARAASLALVD